MNDTNSTSATVSTLRYIGSADTSSYRAVRLFNPIVGLPNRLGDIEFAAVFIVAQLKADFFFLFLSTKTNSQTITKSAGDD